MLARILLMILSLSLASHVFAQNLKCSTNGTVVTFTNGIDTGWNEAKAHLENTKNLQIPAATIDKTGKVEYLLTYNYSESLSLDLYESFRQKMAEFYNITVIVAANRFYNILYKDATAPLIEKFDAITLNAFQSFSLNKYSFTEYNDTINEHSKIWNQAFDENKKIISISHSQGALFTNDAYQKIMVSRPAKYRGLLAMLQVATPAANVTRNQNNISMRKYLTNDQDIIRFVPGAPIPNLTVLSTDLANQKIIDSTGHGFSSVYLKFFALEFKKRLIGTAELLDSNCICEYGGIEQPGKKFINLDGSQGGFIADTASVDYVSYLPKSYVGKDVKICGFTHIVNSYLNGNIIIKDISGSLVTPNNSYPYAIDGSRFETIGNGEIRIDTIKSKNTTFIAMGESKINVQSSFIYESTIVGSRINLDRVVFEKVVTDGVVDLLGSPNPDLPEFKNCRIASGLFSDNLPYLCQVKNWFN